MLCQGTLDYCFDGLKMLMFIVLVLLFAVFVVVVTALVKFRLCDAKIQ